MLPSTEQGRVTLVDYGATVRIGSSIIEFTEQYCLDAKRCTASECLDWICLGTTLAQLAGFDISKFHRAVELSDALSGSSKDDRLKKLIVSCLQNPSSSGIEHALRQFE